MKETITLQLGSYACHVGTHYWNMQTELLGATDDMESESYQAERLFRKVGRQSDSRLEPRALMTDLSENLGYMEFEQEGVDKTEFQLASHGSGGGYGQVDTSVWGGAVSRLARADVPTLSPFQAFLQNTGTDSYYPPSASTFASTGGDVSAESAAAPSKSANMSRRELESSVKKWTDYSQARFTESNMCTLPTWCTTDTFDTFMAGNAQSHDAVLNSSYIDNYLDRIRGFAEECDNLSMIQLFSDSCDGFAGFTASIMEELRQDYRGISIPIFALTRPPQMGNIMHTHQNMNVQLQALSLPYFYSQVSEFASVTIPIACSSWDARWKKNYVDFDPRSHYHSSALVASAIEGLMSPAYLRRPSDSDLQVNAAEPYDMIYQATVAGRVPFCHLESSLPMTTYPDADHNHFLDSINLDPSREHSVAEDYDCRIAGVRSKLNPHMCSLSTAVHGQWKVKPAQRDDEGCKGYSRLSNVVRIRGPSHVDMPRWLFGRCERSKFMVTACVQRQTALYLPKSYPHFFTDVNEFGFIDDQPLEHGGRDRKQDYSGPSCKEPHGCLSITLMSALGADTDMGLHIDNVGSLWESSVKGATHSTKLQAQLNKGGLDEEECEVISQKLHDLTRAYTNE